MAENEAAAADEKRLSIIKIYTKDLSFESPQSPAVFQAEKWSPKTNLNLRTSHTDGGEGFHEIVLTLTIEAKHEADDKTVFLIELQQAGLFEIRGYSPEELAQLAGSFCPNVLYPYARESIASIIQKGGFPEFVLQPINFDALFQQGRANAAAEAQAAGN
jgi:preprotein translocase subunit SecB